MSETNVSNQNNNTEIDITHEKDFLDEETEFLLQDYDQPSSTEDFEETSEENKQYDGVKVNINISHTCFINLNILLISIYRSIFVVVHILNCHNL